MENAKQYHSRLHLSYTATEAKETAPGFGHVLPMDAANQRRSRSPKRKTKIGSAQSVTDGFLKTTFLPKLEITESLQDCRDSEKTESDFYDSLSQLTGYYNILPMDTKAYGYPYNVALALWNIEKRIQKQELCLDEIGFVGQDDKAILITQHRYSTGTSLYYIPVLPLFSMLRTKKRKRTAELLLCVFAYLYHIVDIPYYRQEGSFLWYQYEMIKEWAEQDEEEEEMKGYLRQHHIAEWVGDHMEQKIFHKQNLIRFKHRLDTFTANDDFDWECKELAADAFALYNDYPDENMFRNLPIIDEELDGSYGWYDCTIRMDQYIGFVADTNGCLYQSLEEGINSEFGEYTDIEEPTLTNKFDGSPFPYNNLDFENRLFKLLDDLCYLLNHFKNVNE